MKQISYVKLTDAGRKNLPEAKEVLRKVTDLVGKFAGKIEGMWATTGRYDFIVVTDYPSGEAALKAHTKLVEMEFFLVESTAAFDMETFLATV